jgi:D-tyrosyl-tRNA(Tyr) deacylase
VKAVVQRVRSASVTVDGEIAGAIDRGLLVYLGVAKDDTDRDRTFLVDKITGMRIFENDAGKMDKSVVDVGGALLVVSQFTLFGNLTRGRRPSFDEAAPPAIAEAEYNAFIADARRLVPTETGRFRTHMNVASDNDGPVTILVDSRAARP